MGTGIEVEVKAWVDDRKALEARVGEMAELVDEVRYADTYFTYANTQGYQHQRFRLREFKGQARVTAKVPISNQDPGANREHEFEVSDPEAFRAFCRAFGFRVLLHKEKHCRRYRPREPLAHPLTIELNHIPGLGEFVEVEAMVKLPEEAAGVKTLILRILETLGIPAARIEPVPYTRLLYDRGQRS